MSQSDKRALNSFFSSSSVYAKFDTGFTVSNVIDAIDEDLILQNMFDSIDIIYQHTLNVIVEETKGGLVTHSDHWKEEVIQKLRCLEYLPELNQEQFELLRVLFNEGLQTTTLQNNKLPNIVLVTPSKRDPHKQALSILVCRGGGKSKTLPLRDLARYHKVMPNLKSVRLYMMNIDINESNTTFRDNKIEELDIVLNAFIGSIGDLLMYIFKSYQSSLKTLRLERSHYDNKASKWDKNPVLNSNELKNSQFQLDQLTTLEIKNFYQSLPTVDLINALLTAKCQLKNLSFIGLNNEAVAILPQLLDASCSTLERLSILSFHRPESTLLKGLNALKSLSLHWSDINQHVDVVRFLMLLPHLTCLELGYDGKHGFISHDVISLEKYPSLHKLKLVNLAIKDDEFSHMHEYIPHLTEIGLYNCKFGVQRTDMEANLSLKDYSLKSLIIKDGHLYYSKKDKNREKRAICKFIVTIESNTEMTSDIVSKIKASSRREENISMLNNAFSYICMTNSLIKQLPTLNISVQLLEKLQLDNHGFKAVQFHAVQEQADEIITHAIEDQASMSDHDHTAFEFDDHGVDLPEIEEREPPTTDKEQMEEIDFFADEYVSDPVQPVFEEQAFINKEHNQSEKLVDQPKKKMDSDDQTEEEKSLEQTTSKRQRESDEEYTSGQDESVEEKESSEEEDSRPLRKSARIISKITKRTREKTRRKNARLSSVNETESDPGFDEVEAEKKKKSLRNFMYKVRNYRAVIRLPAK